jgi:general L-amino acid transport system substrate-binding protein
VKFVPLKASDASRAPERVVDLLARNTTCTLGREAGLKVMFPGAIFYDGQAFMVPASSGIRDLRQLDGATVCVEKGTTHQQYLADYFTAHGMRYRPLVIDSSTAVADALFAGRCRAYTSDASQLAAARLRIPGRRPEICDPSQRISKSPSEPVVRGATTTGTPWCGGSVCADCRGGRWAVTAENAAGLRDAAANPALRRLWEQAAAIGGNGWS